MPDETATPAVTTPVYSTEQLAGIKSFDDAMQLLSDAGVAITDIADYGDGFAVLDKNSLIEVPFVIIDYKFADGDYGSDFAIVRVMTKDGRKGIITDGSEKSGIRPQIKDIQKDGVAGGVLVTNGLTRSDYEYVDTDKKRKPASTFYLAM